MQILCAHHIWIGTTARRRVQACSTTRCVCVCAQEIEEMCEQNAGPMVMVEPFAFHGAIVFLLNHLFCLSFRFKHSINVVVVSSNKVTRAPRDQSLAPVSATACVVYVHIHSGEVFSPCVWRTHARIATKCCMYIVLVHKMSIINRSKMCASCRIKRVAKRDVCSANELGAQVRWFSISCARAHFV